MNNLLSAYFQRLFKSRLYWCLLGLMILSGIIIPILAHREMIAYGTDYNICFTFENLLYEKSN